MDPANVTKCGRGDHRSLGSGDDAELAGRRVGVRWLGQARATEIGV